MGAIRRFLGLEKRSAPATIGGPLGADGWPVGHLWAGDPETLAPVLAAVNVIASGIACLPLLVHREVDGERIEAPAHPLARLYRIGPTPDLSWPEWAEWMTAQALLHGMGVSESIWDGRGAVAELRPMPRSEWAPMRAPGGGLVFEHSTTRRRVLARDAVILRDRGDGDGLIGRSRADRAAAVLRGAIALQGRTNTLWERAAAPAGVLQSPRMLNDDVAERMRQQWDAIYGGAFGAGKTAVLEDGLEWKQIQFSPVDSQMLESRRFAAIEVARVFNLPPPLIGSWEFSSYQNAETAGRWLATMTLKPWVMKLESALTRACLVPPFSATLDMSELVRGDPVQRLAQLATLVQHGIITRDEARELEGWGPLLRGTAAPDAGGGGAGVSAGSDPASSA